MEKVCTLEMISMEQVGKPQRINITDDGINNDDDEEEGE